jgi:hypothetical protein
MTPRPSRAERSGHGVAPRLRGVRGAAPRTGAPWRALACALAALLALAPTTLAWGDANAANNGTFKRKLPNQMLPLRNPNANGTATSVFDFHFKDNKPETVSTPYVKNFQNLNVNPNPVVHNSSNTEKHGTTGTITYSLDLNSLVNAQQQPIGYTIGGTINGVIKPGKAEKLKVGEDGSIKDPMTFSDTDPNANFGYVPDGLDYSFTLLAGTSFDTPVASSMLFAARVAPGVIGDPSAFWDTTPPGALDLFTLQLSYDPATGVTPLLTLGSSGGAFALDAHGADVAGIEAQIRAAFLGGTLTTDLNDLFTVGFTPDASLTEFTLGKFDSLTLNEVEVPEPGSLVLAGVGFAGLAALARARRRASPRGAGRSAAG